MTTPQDPAKRHKQKARRSKQLAEWRDKNQGASAAPAAQAAPAKASSAKAAPAKAAPAKAAPEKASGATTK